MVKKAPITLEELHEVLAYDSDTGIFTWKKHMGPRGLKGAVAGSVKDTGYIHTTVRGREYSAHRLAWMYVHGELPTKPIGRRNSDKSDNRIANLFLCVNGQEYRRGTLSINNPSGFTGVGQKVDGMWQARIKVNGKSMYLGNFKTKEEAIERRKRANRKYGFEDGVE